MKRIIPLAFALVLLAGCAQKHYTPAVSTDFNISAVYSAGDFSCSCTVNMKNNAAETPPKNPAKLLYTVFSSLKDCENIKVVDNKYNYVGQTEVGSFLLVQRVEDNKYESVYIADSDIKFEFV